jgi:hypothetical protein
MDALPVLTGDYSAVIVVAVLVVAALPVHTGNYSAVIVVAALVVIALPVLTGNYSAVIVVAVVVVVTLGVISYSLSTVLALFRTHSIPFATLHSFHSVLTLRSVNSALHSLYIALALQAY